MGGQDFKRAFQARFHCLVAPVAELSVSTQNSLLVNVLTSFFNGLDTLGSHMAGGAGQRPLAIAENRLPEIGGQFSRSVCSALT